MNPRILLFSCSLIILFIVTSCDSGNDKAKNKTDEKNFAVESIIMPDSALMNIPAIAERISIIKEALKKTIPILLFKNADEIQTGVQDLAIQNPKFIENLLDPKTKQPYRNEIFNIYEARPQEVSAAYKQDKIYKVEMYNYALNSTSTAFVDWTAKKVISVDHLPLTQPDIPAYLKDLALKIAINNPEVAKALGYKPGESDALMSNTKTALNNTKCERSMHLCVAPTFVQGEKALWAIVDLTDHRVVGIRWTNTGPGTPDAKIGERKLKFDKIMECYCKKVNTVEKGDWKFNYIITTSDGMRISEVYYKGRLVVNNAKVVDWHVSYSNTDGFGYSDAVGCPEFSQAAVVAVSDPRVSEIEENGVVIGFALEQNFSSEQWPKPCNYNYLQRFEFYKDGRFRPAAASLGRGCGNNGTYRPVFRISLAGDNLTVNEWANKSWSPWLKEQWKLQNTLTTYTPEGYQYKIVNADNNGFFLEPGQGQFRDGGRGDNAYFFVTKQHLDKDEGEKDLVTIGPCCNTDYHQGPEKFIEPNPEDIQNTALVLWYVAQMKNDDTKGKEYCWTDTYLENGVYKTRVFPCMCGPMFVPISR